MQSLAFQKNSNTGSSNLIFSHQKSGSKIPTHISHTDIRDAIRAWASASGGQEGVAAMIVVAWRERGGQGLRFPDDTPGQKQKIFRWLDGDSPRYQRYIRELTPAILDILPLEHRRRLAPEEDDIFSRISTAMKECAEAKQAVLLGAPEHQKLKEVSEGIVSLFRLMPEQMGQLMSMVTAMVGVM